MVAKTLRKIVIFLTFGAANQLQIYNNHQLDMKKIILGVAVAGLVVSCQKIQAGSNKGVLQLEDGVERYNQDEMTNTSSTTVDAGTQQVSLPMLDTLRTGDVQEVQIKTEEPSTSAEPTAEPAEKTEN